MSEVSHKPRVLLSILKYACLDTSDSDNLFTAISAGFGRFECDRLLKPSGVELMNLPQTANIEIGVLRRDRATGQKELLYHGLVPLSAVHPAFSPNRSNGDQSSKISDPWEAWLGLFGADVDLKSSSCEHLFQCCLDMGNSGTPFPRLLLRLQYLAPGVSATTTRRSPTASRPQPALEGARSPQKAGANDALRNVGGFQIGSGQTLPGSNQPSAGITPSAGDGGAGGGGASVHSGGGALRALSPSAPHPAKDAWAARPQAMPPTAAGAGRRVRPSSFGSAGGAPVRDSLMNSRTTSGMNYSLNAAPGYREEPPVVSPGVPAPFSLAQGHQGDTSSSAVVRSATGGGPWQSSYDELVRRMEINKASWNEQRATLEAALREAERQAVKREEPPALSARSQYEDLVVVDNHGDGERQLIPARQELRACEAREFELQQRSVNLQKFCEDLKADTLHWKSQDAARQESEQEFLQRIGHALARLGKSVKVPSHDEKLNSDSARQLLEAVATAIEGLPDAKVAAEAKSMANSCEPTAAAFPVPSTDLLEEGLATAIDGGSAAFEQWLGELDPGALVSFVKYEGMLANYRRVASLHCDLAAPGYGQLMYTPEKTDPVDCLLAAQLLRLGPGQLAPDLVRLGSGLYRLLPDGVRLRCFVEQGRLMLMESVGADAEADAMHCEVVETGDKIVKANAMNGEAVKTGDKIVKKGTKGAQELSEYLAARADRLSSAVANTIPPLLCA